MIRLKMIDFSQIKKINPQFWPCFRKITFSLWILRACVKSPQYFSQNVLPRLADPAHVGLGAVALWQ